MQRLCNVVSRETLLVFPKSGEHADQPEPGVAGVCAPPLLLRLSVLLPCLAELPIITVVTLMRHARDGFCLGIAIGAQTCRASRVLVCAILTVYRAFHRTRGCCSPHSGLENTGRRMSVFEDARGEVACIWVNVHRR